MSRNLLLVVCALLLLAYGLVEGYWTDRWSISPELAQAPEKLRDIPLTIGPWVGEETELDPRQARQGRIQGSLLRRYTHSGNGEMLNLLIVCGRPGPITVHGPEVCLGASGYTLVRPEQQKSINSPGREDRDTFWVGRFQRSRAALTEVMEVTWSWNATGDWQAVRNPRLYFAPQRVLYKLYISRLVSSSDSPSTEEPVIEGEKPRDPTDEFLKLLLPEVQRALFPGQ